MNQKLNKAGDISDDDMMGESEIIESTVSQTPSSEEPAVAPELIESPDRAELQAKLTDIEQRLALAEDRALRALAERDNAFRRAEREVADAHKYGIKKLLEELIPVLDSLEQSLTVQESDHALVKNMRDGMALTLQMLQKVLAKFGVKEINPLHESFNPTFHEVMMAQENSEVAPNTILAVMQKGYLLHERVIRPARVMIAKAAS